MFLSGSGRWYPSALMTPCCLPQVRDARVPFTAAGAVGLFSHRFQTQGSPYGSSMPHSATLSLLTSN